MFFILVASALLILGGWGFYSVDSSSIENVCVTFLVAIIFTLFGIFWEIRDMRKEMK